MNAALTYRGEPIAYTTETVNGMAGEVDCSSQVTTFYVRGGPSWSEAAYRHAQKQHEIAEEQLQTLNGAYEAPETPTEIELLLSPRLEEWLRSTNKAYTQVNPDAEPAL